MKIKLEEKKKEAIKALKQLDIYEPYVEGFEKENTVCYFEGYAGFWAYQNEEIMKKIKEIEEKHNCLVYAVTHELTEFGELYDFLIITDYKEEWDYLVEKANINTFYAFAYVWNKTDNDLSEFGTIALRSLGGGIGRLY